MKIGGFHSFSLIDYPDMISAVVFTQGCNFRCPFCHNPELVMPDHFGEVHDEADIFTYLEKRRGQLDAVVVCGGEPTIHDTLPVFLRRIKEMGFLVKLDTNGTRPQMIQSLIDAELVDFIAMDVKAPFEKYPLLAGVACKPSVVKQSIDIIMAAGIPHEFRTTYAHHFLDKTDLVTLKALLKDCQSYRIQEYIPPSVKPHLRPESLGMHTM